MFGPVLFFIVAVSGLICYFVKFRVTRPSLDDIEDEKKRNSTKYMVYSMPVFSIAATVAGCILFLEKDYEGALAILSGAACLSVGGTSFLEKILRESSK